MVYYKTKYSAKGSSLSSSNYRFGYQGSEKDNEVNSSNGSSYTTEFRQLDTRLGRWFSSDPVFQPWQSSYTSMDNNPINLTDFAGLSTDGEKREKGSEYIIGTGPEAKKRYEKLKEENTNPDVGYEKRTDKWGDDYYFEVRYKPLSPSEQKNNETTTSEETVEISETNIPNEIPNSENKELETNSEKVVEPSSKPKEDLNPKPNDGLKPKPKPQPKPQPQPNEVLKPELKPKPTEKPKIKGEVPKGHDFIVFEATPGLPGYSKSWNFDRKTSELANWLKNNPDYNLVVTLGGGGVTADSWNDNIGFSSTTYDQRIKLQTKERRDALNKLGIDKDRVKFIKGDVNSWGAEAKPVLRN